MLNATERQRLQWWLDSPAHNRRPEVVALYELLVNHLHYWQSYPTREQAFAVAFPQTPFDDLRLRQVCTYLFRACEAWLVYPEPVGGGASSLLAAYRERNMGRHFDSAYRKATQALARSPYRNPEYHWAVYQLKQERYRWESQRTRSGQHNMLEQEEALQTATLGFKLRQACLSLAYQQVQDVSVPIPMLRAYLAHATTLPYAEVPSIRLYYLAVQLYQSPEEDQYFQDFVQAFTQWHPLFPTEEARDLLLLGINFGIRRINQGQADFLRTTLDLYRQGLGTSELLLEKGKLNVYAFNNISGIALRINDLDWVDFFIHRYRKRLSGRHSENIFALNAARLAYAREDYPLALSYLEQTGDRDFIIHMTARILILKIYVEQTNFDTAIDHIRNTDIYLKRQNNTGFSVENYRNILQLTEAFCRLKPLAIDEKARLLAQVQQAQPLTEK